MSMIRLRHRRVFNWMWWHRTSSSSNAACNKEQLERETTRSFEASSGSTCGFSAAAAAAASKSWGAAAPLPPPPLSRLDRCFEGPCYTPSQPQLLLPGKTGAQLIFPSMARGYGCYFGRAFKRVSATSTGSSPTAALYSTPWLLLRGRWPTPKPCLRGATKLQRLLML